jgi:peptidoglycan/LPS O-acetylase OafA/YrhL
MALSAPKPGVNEGIQILRGAAALLVVLHHSLEETLALPSADHSLDWWVRFGASGVDIFFVISGFVIFSSVWRGPGAALTSWSRFILARFHRIYPFYWVCLAAVIVLASSGLAFTSMQMSASRLVTSVLLLPSPSQIIGVAWTLVYELWFYWIVGLVILLRWPARMSAFAIVALIIAAIGAGRWAGDGLVARFVSDPIVLEFCYGILLALLLRHATLSSVWVFPLAGIGFLLLMVASALAPSETTNGIARTVRFEDWGIPAVFVVAAFAAIPRGYSVAFRFAVMLGNASYAIYLTHVFVMIGYAKLIKVGVVHGPGWADAIGATLAAIALGVAAHFLVEQPLRQTTRGLFLLQRRPAADGSPA